MKQLARAEVSHRNGGDFDEQFRKLDRWTFLMMQVFESKSFLDLAESTHAVHPQSSLNEVLTQQALFRSFLLSYGKCFSSSGKGRSSLDIQKVFAGAPRVLCIHERIMELRNRFAAHNDRSGLDDALIDVQELEDEFVISHRYAIANPLQEYASYREAIAVLESYVVTQTDRLLLTLETKLQKKVRVRSSI